MRLRPFASGHCPTRVSGAEAAGEARRLEDAHRLAAEELKRPRQRAEAGIGQAESGIFDVQLSLLTDRRFIDRIGERIGRTRMNAEWAVEATVREQAHLRADAEVESVRERPGERA